MTLEERIDELRYNIESMEDYCDKKAQEIEDEIAELLKLACENCGGTGSCTYRLNYPDFVIDKCNKCNGTGYSKDEDL